MQEYRGQYLQVFAAVQPYGDDLFSLGRDTAAQLVAAIHNDPGSREPFLPRLALVLFTQTDEGAEPGAGEPSAGLSALCGGINAGLGNCGARPADVPVIGCSVASIPDPEGPRILRRIFSLTLLAARARDLEAQVGGSAGFVNEKAGHEKAWSSCLDKLGEQDVDTAGAGGAYRDDSFVLAFFPGLVQGADDFKVRGLASYEFLRDKLSADLAIYGAGAGEFGGAQRRCQVMAGSELIPNGYVCAKVRTTLVFKLRMDHSLKMASEVLLVKSLKEGHRGRFIASLGVAPDFHTVPARQVLTDLQQKYGVQDFTFRAIELSGRKESLLFHSVNPKEDSLTLAGPIEENTLIRPAFSDLSDSALARDLVLSLPEDGPVALNVSLLCNGIFRLSGTTDDEREAAILRQLRQARASRGAPGFPLVSGFVFGEWGVGPELSGRAQYYHSTSLSLADALTSRHRQRRQLEIIDRCSHDVLAALLAGEAAEPKFPLRRAAALLAEPLFDAIEDLGYDGGLISLANEVDQTLVGTVARGEVWDRIRKTLVVRLDEIDVVARAYREASRGPARHHVADCNQDPFCAREAKAGIVSQTVVPLWDGGRCLGVLQVGLPARPVQILDVEGSALSDIAHHLALHLRRVRSQEAIRELDEAVRFAIGSDDQEKGWCFFAQVAARAVEVPFCTIRVLDSTDHFLKLVGGSHEILEPTHRHRPSYTPVSTGDGPVIDAFRRFKDQESPALEVVQEAAQDAALQALARVVPDMAAFYGRIGSYALGKLVSPRHGCIGVISFVAFQPQFFTTERRKLAQKIAGDASIIAKVYRSVRREQSILTTTLSLATIQAEVDKILRSLRRDDAGFAAAARLLVTETVRILPCEACTLHLFSEARELRFQDCAPEGILQQPAAQTAAAKENLGLLLHLATQREIYRAAGEELRSQAHVQAGAWTWLPATQQLHSLLAVPLVDPQGRSHGILTLYNQLNEEGRPDDALDFTDVPTRLRSFLQEIATHVFENLESRARYARLADVAAEIQMDVDGFLTSTTEVSKEALFCNLAQRLAAWLDAQICSVFLVSHPERQLVLRGCYGWQEGDKLLRRARYELGDGLTGALARNTEPAVIASIFVDGRRTGKYEKEMYGSPDSAHTYELIALPLRQGEEPLGIITLYRKLPAEHAHALGFNQRDSGALRLACRLARLAVAAVEGELRSEEALEQERPAIAEILSAAGQMRLQPLDYDDVARQIARRFQAGLCGIFLAEGENRSIVRLRGASGQLATYVEKVAIEKNAGPVGQAFASQETEFRDRPEDLEYIGQLNETLRQCLGEPPKNLMASPMRLGDECEGVILLVDRHVLAQSEQSSKVLPQYHLETLGTGILLIRHNLEYAEFLQTTRQAITEQQDAILANSVAMQIVHSWRNHLQAIAGTVSPLRSPTLKPARRDELLSTIEATCDLLSRPLDELLAPIRRAGLRETVDLADVVRRALDNNREAASERSVRIINQVRAKTLVLGRRTQLVGVVGTILENAIEACDKIPRKIDVYLLPPRADGMVGLVIADNGKGISRENQSLIFVESFTTHPGERKRGFGLNFAKSMLLFYGGDIEVKSTLNKGTLMTVWLRGESTC